MHEAEPKVTHLGRKDPTSLGLSVRELKTRMRLVKRRWIMSIGERWSVDLSAQESEGETVAVARLNMDGDEHLVGRGRARLNPLDRGVEKIGVEIAVARALSDLAHRLLHAAAVEVEGMTHERAHLHL